MKIAKALGLAVLNSLQLLGHTRGRDGGVREELAAGVAVTPSKCCTLARCLTCETLGHARVHGCRARLYRDSSPAVRRGRRKHWLPRSSPSASIHRAPPCREPAAIKERKSCNSGRPKSCNRNNWRALTH